MVRYESGPGEGIFEGLGDALAGRGGKGFLRVLATGLDEVDFGARGRASLRNTMHRLDWER